MPSGITIDDKQMRTNFKNLEGNVSKLIKAVMVASAPSVENYAKMNAPWTDRTGNARNTLNAVYGYEEGKHSIIISHGMPYGLWLEVKNSGKYRIIEPTVRTMGPKVMSKLNGLLNKL